MDIDVGDQHDVTNIELMLLLQRLSDTKSP